MFRSLYPNPSGETRIELFWTSTIAGILLYILLLIYQPFGTSQFNHTYKYLLLLPYGLIASVTFFVVGILLPKQKEKWTLGLEVIAMLLKLFIISVLSYIYNTLYISKIPLSLENYAYMFVYTVALCAPISIIYILGRYIYLNKKHRSGIEIAHTSINILTTSDTLHNGTIQQQKLCIVADYGMERLEMAKEDFIYAESADNYCNLYFYYNDQIDNKMIRISLTKLLGQISSESIQQVHRSFIVNLYHVISFKGNSSGYKISLKNIDKELNISRKYIHHAVPILKGITGHP